MSRFIAAAAVSVALLLTQPAAHAQGAGEHWVGTWATAVVGRAVRPPAGRGGGQGPQGQAPQAAAPAAQAPPAPQAPPPPPINFNNQTLREIVHASIGGDRVRVVLSNEFGDAPLMIGGAHVGLRGAVASIVPGSDRAITFAGRPGTSIPAGAGNLDLRISLRQAAQRERDVMLIGPRAALVTFTDIGWNRNCSPSQLRCKTV